MNSSAHQILGKVPASPARERGSERMVTIVVVPDSAADREESKMEAARRREYERMWKKIQSGALVVTKAQEAAIRKILYGK